MTKTRTIGYNCKGQRSNRQTTRNEWYEIMWKIGNRNAVIDREGMTNGILLIFFSKT